MFEWKEYSIGSLCNITRGASPRPINDWMTTKDGKPWLKIADATSEYGRFISSTKEQIKLEAVSKSVEVFPGDLIVSNSATPGIPKFLRINACIHDGWLLLRNIDKNINKEFLYYLIIHIRPNLLQLGNGSIFTNLKTDILKEYTTKFPPFSEQSQIASILSALDDKIDLLHRQNRTLEQLADTLFRQWFVVEAEGSWDVGKLGNAISVKGGTTPSTTNPEYWNGSIHWTSPRDLSKNTSIFLFDTERKITEKGLEQIGSGLLPIGSVLLSSRAPIGYLVITEIPVAINQGYIAIVCDKLVSNHFIYLWIKKNLDTIISASNGSVFLEISKSTFKELNFTIPPKDKLKLFDNEIEPIFQKIKSNQTQIRTLTQLRDTLLPKLMSGELQIDIK